jgi:hypothetical protein
MINNELIKPTVYDQYFHGLESISAAMSALAERKVWGKAVILIESSCKSKI